MISRTRISRSRRLAAVALILALPIFPMIAQRPARPRSEVERRIAMPKGGKTDPEIASKILGALPGYSEFASSMKANCR